MFVVRWLPRDRGVAVKISHVHYYTLNLTTVLSFIMVNKLFLLVVAILCGICSGREEQTIDISPKCAAVLVTAGAAGGGAVAYALAPAALCQAGFCSAGVTSSSFASWWQSTLPLVQSGSLFGTLQSIAMGGVSTKMVVTGSVLGGQLSTMYLQQLCGYVDNPDSKMAS